MPPFLERVGTRNRAEACARLTWATRGGVGLEGPCCGVRRERLRRARPASGGAMWLNRLASVRGGGSRPASAPSGEEASTSAAAPLAATSAPSPSSQAKAEAAKKYIENMYKERGKVAMERLERRRSLDSSGTAVRLPARPQRRTQHCALRLPATWADATCAVPADGGGAQRRAG